MQYSNIGYSHYSVHYIPMTFYFTAENLYLLTPFSQVAHPLPPASGNQFVICIYELGLVFFCFVLFFQIPQINEQIILHISQ